MVALYLRGLPRPRLAASHWREVWRFLRACSPSLPSAEAHLRRAGFEFEAAALGTPQLLSHAERLCAEGRALSLENPHLPLRWRTAGSLPSASVARGFGQPTASGSCSGPAFWVEGEPPPPGRCVGVVGVRLPSLADSLFAEEIGRELVPLGYSVISGGAVGCDAVAQGAASRADGFVLEMVPFGLQWPGQWSPAVANCRMSICAPEEAFSRHTAMERNALIYSAADLTVVVRARFREGGTWHGATNALRRRLGAVAVRAEAADAAARALVALGAHPLKGVSDLLPTLTSASEDALAIPGLMPAVTHS